jgi:membrane-bound serine protease (ClpP class)
MRNTVRRAGVALGLAFVALPAATAAAQPQIPVVVHLSLEGVVDPFVAGYLEGGIARAEDEGAAAVLITIDTPGGLDSSMRDIVKAILASEVPVVCYVSPQGARAASAGAFILLACPVAAMAPGTNVGASTPVGYTGAVLQRKATEDAVAYIRSLAEQRGRNADLAESFVRDAESVSAEEALEGNAIDLIAPSTPDLLADIDGRTVTVAEGDEVVLRTAGTTLVSRSMGFATGLLHALLDPNLVFLFFWLGLALLVLELLVPGHIFSGTIGTVLLASSLLALGFLPVRLIGIALLVASVVFFVLELKVPGLGAWSLAGIAALVAGGLLLFDPAGGVRVSPFVIAPTAAAIAAFFGVVVSKVLAMRHLPPAQGPQSILGRRGVVIGAGLSPEGLVRVAAEEWRAVSSAGDLPPGSKVEVTAIDGFVLTVAPVAEHEHEPARTPAAEGGKDP